MGESRFLSPAAVALAPLSAPRLFILGGLALIIAGMLFGDIFAVFVLHQNGGRTGAMLLAAAQAAADQDAAGVRNAFGSMVGLLEDRGTKIDTHVHVTDAGYLSLLLALIQPYVAFSAYRKRQLAQSFLAGSIMLAVGIFLIHYVGVAHSPFAVIGWGSVLADAGGALLVLAVAAEMWGLWNHFRANPLELKPEFPGAISWAERALLSGGTLLVLLGFLYGAWYAAFDLYPQERVELRILNDLAIEASSHNHAGIAHAVDDYGGLSAARALSIAAHSHVIEFGLLALLLSFVQPYIFLSEVWKTRWAVLFITGSVLLPLFVRLEFNIGLVAGGIADIAGLLVLAALIAMFVGVLRHTGRVDSAEAV